jgi:hypothetical protein
MQRVQVGVRLLLLLALASIGCSSAYWLVYLALPVVAALLVSRDGATRYLGEDSRGTIRVLRWAARAYAYLWLLSDAVPSAEASAGPVDFEVVPGGAPTPSSALVRLLSSLPALLLLSLLSIVAVPLWVIGAVAILITERTPAPIADFIAMKLRYQFRLVAYHLSLVDAYPSLVDADLTEARHSGAT